MFVVCVQSFVNNGMLTGARGHPLELEIAYTALLFMGAGKFSLESKVPRRAHASACACPRRLKPPLSVESKSGLN